MDETAKNVLKNVVGVTDEDLAKVPRNVEKIFANASRAMGYKLIAEVTSFQILLRANQGRRQHCF